MTDRNRLPRYILESWATEENPWYTTEELLEWIEETRRQLLAILHQWDALGK